jgi:hypothetical protein
MGPLAKIISPQLSRLELLLPLSLRAIGATPELWARFAKIISPQLSRLELLLPLSLRAIGATPELWARFAKITTTKTISP